MTETVKLHHLGVAIPTSYRAGNYRNTYRPFASGPKLIENWPQPVPATAKGCDDLLKRLFDEAGVERNIYFWAKGWFWKVRKGEIKPLREKFFRLKSQVAEQRRDIKEAKKKKDKFLARALEGGLKDLLPELEEARAVWEVAAKPIAKAYRANRARWDRMEPRYENALTEASAWCVEANKREAAEKRRAEAKRKKEEAEAKRKKRAAAEAKRKKYRKLEVTAKAKKQWAEHRIKNLEQRILALPDDKVIRRKHARVRSILAGKTQPNESEIAEIKKFATKLASQPTAQEKAAKKKAQGVAKRRKAQNSAERKWIADIQTMTEAVYRTEYAIPLAEDAAKQIGLNPSRKRAYVEQLVGDWKAAVARWKKSGKPVGEW